MDKKAATSWRNASSLISSSFALVGKYAKANSRKPPASRTRPAASRRAGSLPPSLAVPRRIRSASQKDSLAGTLLEISSPILRSSASLSSPGNASTKARMSSSFIPLFWRSVRSASILSKIRRERSGGNWPSSARICAQSPSRKLCRKRVSAAVEASILLARSRALKTSDKSRENLWLSRFSYCACIFGSSAAAVCADAKGASASKARRRPQGSVVRMVA